MREVSVDGRSVAYREAGTGAPLVFLHGFLSDSRCWLRQLAGLSERFRTVAWDAPGAGNSSDPPEGFSTADYVQALAGFLDAIDVPTAHLVGLSWGDGHPGVAAEDRRPHAPLVGR
jgi:pimeloyl-ACP methyl ester carboxylesterase